MTEKISVIVPIYNVEQYLERCLLSIINQTYSNLEIILVDDGSLDSSGAIADGFIEQDDRIIVYHKRNGGLSDARNFGEERATGEYIIFIDSDDYVHELMIEELYDQLIKENAEVSCCNVMNVYQNSQTPQCENEHLYYVYDTENFLREYLVGQVIPGSICNKLIKREITKQLEFPVGKIYEDAYYHYDLINIANRYVVNTKPRYYYFHRKESITTAPFAPRDMAYLYIYNKFYCFIQDKYPNLIQEAFFRLSYAYFYILDKMLLNDNFNQIKEYQQVVYFLKKNGFKIIRNNLFRNSRRIATVFLMIHVRLYRALLLRDKASKRIS